MIYVLDHYYAMNHTDFCCIVSSEKSVQDLVEICSAISFLLETQVDMDAVLDQTCLLHILEDFYDVTDVKSDFSEEMIRAMQLPIRTAFEKMPNKEIYLMDLYEARESQCGPVNCPRIMEKWLPKGEAFEDLLLRLRQNGVE